MQLRCRLLYQHRSLLTDLLTVSNNSVLVPKLLLPQMTAAQPEAPTQISWKQPGPGCWHREQLGVGSAQLCLPLFSSSQPKSSDPAPRKRCSWNKPWLVAEGSAEIFLGIISEQRLADERRTLSSSCVQQLGTSLGNEQPAGDNDRGSTELGLEGTSITLPL